MWINGIENDTREQREQKERELGGFRPKVLILSKILGLLSHTGDEATMGANCVQRGEDQC